MNGCEVRNLLPRAPGQLAYSTRRNMVFLFKGASAPRSRLQNATQDHASNYGRMRTQTSSRANSWMRDLVDWP
jgi:hypothetical protein